MTIDINSYKEAEDYIDYLEFKLIQAELDCKAKVVAAYAEGMREAAVLAYQFEGNNKPLLHILSAIPKGN